MGYHILESISSVLCNEAHYLSKARRLPRLIPYRECLHHLRRTKLDFALDKHDWKRHVRLLVLLRMRTQECQRYWESGQGFYRKTEQSLSDEERKLWNKLGLSEDVILNRGQFENCFIRLLPGVGNDPRYLEALSQIANVSQMYQLDVTVLRWLYQRLTQKEEGSQEHHAVLLQALAMLQTEPKQCPSPDAKVAIMMMLRTQAIRQSTLEWLLKQVLVLKVSKAQHQIDLSMCLKDLAEEIQPTLQHNHEDKGGTSHKGKHALGHDVKVDVRHTKTAPQVDEIIKGLQSPVGRFQLRVNLSQSSSDFSLDKHEMIRRIKLWEDILESVEERHRSNFYESVLPENADLNRWDFPSIGEEYEFAIRLKAISYRIQRATVLVGVV